MTRLSNSTSAGVTSIDWENRCVRCSAPLPENARSSRDYCSKKCYNDHYQEIEKAERAKVKAHRPPCAVCGKPIPASRDMRAVYCSVQCNHTGQLVNKTCPHCRNRFRGHKGQVHCSWFCYCQVAKRIHQPRPCDWCGTMIMQPDSAGRRFCSLSCAGKEGMRVRLQAPTPLTRNLLDRLFENVRPKRSYTYRLTAQRFDKLLGC